MSQENVEIVRRVYEASARRDTETVLSLYASDIEWDMRRNPYGELFETDVRIGHAELRAWFREWYAAFEDFEHECDELIDAGDHVVTVGTDRCRGRESGVQVERTLAGVWTLRNGKVVRVVWFASKEQALHEVGVRE